jgi:hypothetical protein
MTSIPQTERGDAAILLFDAAALRDDERAVLREAGVGRWLYADLGDSQARDHGPVWAPHTTTTAALQASLWADPQRAWSTAALQLSGPLDEREPSLARHFRVLRHVHDHAGQRYFFRIADTRCLTAMHAVLNPAQRTRLFGPVRRWQFVGRDGQAAVLQAPDAPPPAVPTLRLQARQLAQLLDLTWPDQLVASALDAHPELESRATPACRHALASDLCAVLRREGIERYPVQLAALVTTLRAEAAAPQLLQDAGFFGTLRQAEASGDAQPVLKYMHHAAASQPHAESITVRP